MQACSSSSRSCPPCELLLSPDVHARLLSAAATARLPPGDFISFLLRRFHDSLGGLPLHVLAYIFSFLDYSTVSLLVPLTCIAWKDLVRKGESAKFFGQLRQVHGVHVIDPARGVFYLPRALKRVLAVEGDETSAEGPHTPPPAGVPDRRGRQPTAPIPAASLDMAASASSFLTVHIRTQDTRSLPWLCVKATVQRAIEAEKMEYGEVRTTALQRPEDPALTQAAIASFDRRVYIFGGETYEGVVLNRCQTYDPLRRRWDVLPPLREARAAATAVVSGGLIFVFGGYSQTGDVFDTYEVFETTTRRWQSPSLVNGSRGFRMPAKVCGLAGTWHEGVIFLAGGYRSRLAPDGTAFTYSLANSASTTPVHDVPRSASAFVTTPSVLASSSSRGGNGESPPRSPAAAARSTVQHSISRDGPPDAESCVWVFCPRSHAWWTQGPRLPSPRAFGALVVLNIQMLGECLCYFGGCARADQPETAMLYVPLAPDPRGRQQATTANLPHVTSSVELTGTDSSRERSFFQCAVAAATATGLEDSAASVTVAKEVSRDDPPSTDTPAATTSGSGAATEGKSFPPSLALLDARQLELSSVSSTTFVARPNGVSGSAVALSPTTPGAHPPYTSDPHLQRYFTGDRMAHGTPYDWQRYSRVPLGGAFTSVAVLGSPGSRTLVLSSFYPAPLIGYCKVNDLVPVDLSERFVVEVMPPKGDSPVLPGPPTPPPRAPQPTSAAVPADELRTTSESPAVAGVLLSESGPSTAQQQQRHQEREWSQHQRLELRQLMGAAVDASGRRCPVTPQAAGESRKWSLAPMAEVQVRDDRGRPLLNRVSWKTQALNGKFIVGME